MDVKQKFQFHISPFLHLHDWRKSIGNKLLGGGFIFFKFSPLLGEMLQFDEHIFDIGWFNHQL